MAGLYEDARARVDRIFELYESLCAEVEVYRDWAQEQVDAEHAKPDPDPRFLSAMGLQVRFPTRLLEVLEEQAFDEYIHFADRVIRIKHYEDGVFI